MIRSGDGSRMYTGSAQRQTARNYDPEHESRVKHDATHQTGDNIEMVAMQRKHS